MRKVTSCGVMLVFLGGLAVGQDLGLLDPVLIETGIEKQGSGTPLLLAVDVDGDGLDDLATITSRLGIGASQYEVHVAVNNGDGTFETPEAYVLPMLGRDMKATDLDGDGDQDLVVTHRAIRTAWDVDFQDYGNRTVTATDGVSVLINDGSGAYTLTPFDILGQNAFGLTFMDVDSDGNRDIVVGVMYGPTVLFGDGDGGFPRQEFLGDTFFNGEIHDIEAADIDDDGDDDLVFLHNYQLAVLENQGGGTFTSATAPGLVDDENDRLLLITPADMDGDGDVDFVASPSSVGGGFAGLRFFENDGSGAFADGVTIPTGPDRLVNVQHLDAVDVSGDARPELLLSAHDFAVQVFENRGDGTFFPARFLEPQPGNQHVNIDVAAGALIGDPATDLMVFVGEAQYELTIFPGSSAPPPVASAITPASVDLGTTVDLEISGTGFDDDVAIEIGPFATIQQLVRNSSTSLTATIAFDAAPPVGFVPGSQEILVRNPDGKSRVITLDVQPGALPVASAITPSTAVAGSTVEVVLDGAGFDAGIDVSFGDDVTVNSLVRDNETRLVANVTIGADSAVGPRDLTLTNPTGQTTTLDDAFTVVRPLTLDLVTQSGKLKDATRAGRDSVLVKGSLAFNGFSADSAFSSAVDDVTVRIGDAASPFEFTIPAGDPRWRVRSGKQQWKSPRRTLPRVKVLIDTDRGTFKIQVSRFDLPSFPDSSVLVDVRAGDDHGVDERTWVPKGDNKLKL